MREATSPIPHAPVSIDDEAPHRLMRRLPEDLAELARFAREDDEFLPPHWVRMRVTADPSVTQGFLAALRRLAPLVGPLDAEVEKTLESLLPDPAREGVAAMALAALASEAPGPTADRLFALAVRGRGPAFDAAFSRDDVPLSAHLLRLSALRDKGGMTWSEAFATRVSAGLPAMTREAQAWTVRLIGELKDPQALAYLRELHARSEGTPLFDEVARILANPPTFVLPPDVGDELPSDIESLELIVLDTRKPERRVLALGAMAALDWNRARRMASSLEAEEWRLDEVAGALLNYPSLAIMREDFERRGLIPSDSGIASPKLRPSARELMRRHGRVVRFDTTSPDGLDGVVDHDALAYRLAAMAGDCFDGFDFLEELKDGESVGLDAWGHGRHYRAELDTSRSIIDPYGLVGLLNSIARDRLRPERFMFAAEDKAVADVVSGDERELRGLVAAGLMWIKTSFKW